METSEYENGVYMLSLNRSVQANTPTVLNLIYKVANAIYGYVNRRSIKGMAVASTLTA